MRTRTLYTNNPGFPHSLRIYTVYLVFFFLTMLVDTKTFAYTSADEIPTDPMLASTSKTDLLYTLLIAEMAGHRNMKRVALHHYMEAANLITDPKVAEEATLLAINLEAPEEAIKSAELWAKRDPHNIQAQLIAMTLLISQSLDRAIPYLTRAIDLQPMEADQTIIEIQARLSEKSANNLKRALHRIALDRPKDPYAQLTAAQSFAEAKDARGAARWVDSALKLKPELTRGIVLKSRLIRYEKNAEAPALQYLKSEQERFPQDKELRFFYARALIDAEKIEEAKDQLMILTSDKVLGGPALLFLGEIYLKENRLTEAQNTFRKALTLPESKDAALYLLGEIEERQNHPTAAIDSYTSVSPGTYHVPAALRAITLLKQKKAYAEAINVLHNTTPANLQEQKHLLITEIDLLNRNKKPEDAMQLADEILPKLPNDTDILFIHATTAINLGKWEIAEADLKNILKQHPDNASALNALGYTISFNESRLPEAIHYMTQALSIAPNNPHFMDSMGWAYFRLGKLEEALNYLQKAHQISPDAKIAAHFGEVLWMNNQKTEAKQIWKKALDTDTDHEELLNTLKRLDVKLSSESDL